MAKTKRHTEAEIAAKLQQAEALAAQGRTQNEIAQALGISIMTFHRWRKAQPPQSVRRVPVIPPSARPEPERQNRIAELQNENAQLRRLVTDLLLEKMRLEDELKQDASLKKARR